MSIFDYNCGKPDPEVNMESASVRLSLDLLDAARTTAKEEHRTVQGQIERWARIGKACIENPDLPVDFVAASLESLAEPREQATPFIPKTA
jgi:hypothetical protein